ncbi:MAG: phosphatase PAP2 family protein [Bacteroidia bacterium]|nr:phosphatase PAP2 family protein [Bacteroidia bacterium]
MERVQPLFWPRMKAFWLTLGVIFGAGLIWVLWHGYQTSFLLLHSLRASWLDMLMPHFTHLGDGVILTVCISLMLLRQDKALIVTTILGMLLIGLLIGQLKHQLFDDWLRPAAVFTGEGKVHLISLGRELFHAFPSGHAAAAAGMMFFAAFAWSERYPWVGAGAALMVGLIGYSRIYIGVHFVGDILAGIVTGLLITGTTLAVAYPALSRWFSGFSPRTHAYWTAGLLTLGILVLTADIYLLYDTYYR